MVQINTGISRVHLLLLLCLSFARAQNNQISHFILNDANLVETQQGFALSAPSLLGDDSKTVSVNGNQIIKTQPNCQQQVLTNPEPQQQVRINDAKQMLHSAISSMNPQFPIHRAFSGTYSHGNVISTHSRNVGISSFQSNGLSITKYDEQNMSIGKSAGLPDNIDRVFITGDVVTFVYNDGRVEMKPIKCLRDDENYLVQQLKGKVQRAHVQFNQDMTRFHQNMQQSMDQLRQNLNNMFSRGFPFNQNNQFGQQYVPGVYHVSHQQPQRALGFGLGLGANIISPVNNFMGFMPNIPGFGAHAQVVQAMPFSGGFG